MTHFKRMMSLCLVIPLCSCVVAWGQSYHIESGTPSSVVIKYAPSSTNIRAVQMVAEDYCQQFSKDAAPYESTKSVWGIYTVSFACKETSAAERAEITRREMAQQAKEQADAARARAMMASSMQSMADSLQSIGDSSSAVANSYNNSVPQQPQEDIMDHTPDPYLQGQLRQQETCEELRRNHLNPDEPCNPNEPLNPNLPH